MRNIMLINLLIALNLIVTSCQKDDAYDNEDNNNEMPHNSSCYIPGFFAKVELEGENSDNRELIEQIENEIKESMAVLGRMLTFYPSNEDSSSGELIRTYDDKTEVKSKYRIETTENNLRYLKIIDNDVEVDSYQIFRDVYQYLVKDFTEEYNPNYKIITALGAARITMSY